ncbi:MAG: hypothetical protein EXR58_04250 [Chloroflexi bacterium]|nr:hypothetical protein [Chloroflexota bacterium]
MAELEQLLKPISLLFFALLLTAALPSLASAQEDLSTNSGLLPGDPLHRTFAEFFRQMAVWQDQVTVALASGTVGAEPVVSDAFAAPPGSARFFAEKQAHEDWVAQVVSYVAGQPEGTDPALLPAGGSPSDLNTVGAEGTLDPESPPEMD